MESKSKAILDTALGNPKMIAAYDMSFDLASRLSTEDGHSALKKHETENTRSPNSEETSANLSKFNAELLGTGGFRNTAL